MLTFNAFLAYAVAVVNAEATRAAQYSGNQGYCDSLRNLANAIDSVRRFW